MTVDKGNRIKELADNGICATSCKGQSESGNPLEREAWRQMYWRRVVALCITAFAFWRICISDFAPVEDINMEAMDMPLTMAHVMRARSLGMSVKKYFAQDAVWDNLKSQNPNGAYAYFGRRFQFEFFAYQAPLCGALYVPFVALCGVSVKAVLLYSTVFAAIAWVATGIVGTRMYNLWAGLLAMNLLAACLSWVIHINVGYAAHMPGVLLMVLLAYGLWGWIKEPSYCASAVCGLLLGCMYLLGWLAVVFGAAAVGIAMLTIVRRESRLAVRHCGYTVISALATIHLGVALYSIAAGCDIVDVHESILSVMTGRFLQGGVPGVNLSIAGKMWYAWSRTFWDMETFDHLDKCLEGYPAIPAVLSVLFLVGVTYAIKERRPEDRVLLVWLVSVYGVLGIAFLYTHRYALLALPAMSLLAARGVVGIWEDLDRARGRMMSEAFGLIVAFFVAVAVAQTHQAFFEEYISTKAPDFEIDRTRGHAGFAKWLKKHCPPEETMVVLGDPTMFPHTSFLFNTYGWNYRFAYWSNYFRTGSTAAQAKAWEAARFDHHPRIVYAFSTALLPGPRNGVFKNDWRAFIRAHPGIRPAWRYAYGRRPPSIVVFEVNAPSETKLQERSPNPAKKPRAAP